MRVVLTGASGQLGSYLAEALAGAGHVVVPWSATSTGRCAGIELVPVELTDSAATERALAAADPELIVHAAAMSAAEAVWRDPGAGRRINVEATARLADWCQRHDRRLVFTSTDLVFDGKRSWYRENDPAVPVLAYGRTKREAEHAVLAVPRGLVVRLSLLYGPSRCGRPSFFERTLDAIRKGQPQALFVDEFRTPIALTTASLILARLAQSELTGLIHVAGTERLSRHELIHRAAVALGLDVRLAQPNRRADVSLLEPRPADVSLDTSRLAALMPDAQRATVEEALAALKLT